MSKRGKKKTHLFTKPLFEENFRLEMEKQLHEFKENHELEGKQIKKRFYESLLNISISFFSDGISTKFVKCGEMLCSSNCSRNGTKN